MKKYPHGLTLNAVCEALEDYQRHEDSVPEEGILAAFNTLLGHSDIAEALRSMERTADTNMAAAQALRDDMYHWKERAEAAEAKLADLEKQPPVGEAVNIGGVIMVEWERCISDGTQLFTRPAPAINLAELVPENPTGEMQAAGACAIKFETTAVNKLFTANAVYRAMRAVLLRNIEGAK